MENKERIKFLKDKKIIAIDPGKNGGISVFSFDRNQLIEVVKMPETPRDVFDFLKFYSINSHCFLERVQGLPGQGGFAMFTFGQGFGHLQMALIALKIPTQEVTPQHWLKTQQFGSKGKKSTTEWKNKLKNRAQQLYPKIKVTLAISDSLLILEYGKQQKPF